MCTYLPKRSHKSLKSLIIAGERLLRVFLYLVLGHWRLEKALQTNPWRGHVQTSRPRRNQAEARTPKVNNGATCYAQPSPKTRRTDFFRHNRPHFIGMEPPTSSLVLTKEQITFELSYCHWASLQVVKGRVSVFVKR